MPPTNARAIPSLTLARFPFSSRSGAVIKFGVAACRGSAQVLLGEKRISRLAPSHDAADLAPGLLGNGQKSLNYVGIELAARFAGDFIVGFGKRQGLPIGPIRSHGIQ